MLKAIGLGELNSHSKMPMFCPKKKNSQPREVQNPPFLIQMMLTHYIVVEKALGALSKSIDVKSNRWSIAPWKEVTITNHQGSIKNQNPCIETYSQYISSRWLNVREKLKNSFINIPLEMLWVNGNSNSVKAFCIFCQNIQSNCCLCHSFPLILNKYKCAICKGRDNSIMCCF